MCAKFNYIKPLSLDEALRLAGENSSSTFLAGGTDIMVKVKNMSFRPDVFIDIAGINEFQGITINKGKLHIGALTSHNELANSDLIKKYVPALAKAASKVGSPQIRNRGTIGGNIVNASPAADTVPALIAMGAMVELVSREGIRKLPLEEFAVGPGKTLLRPAELVRKIFIDPQTPHQSSSFIKMGKRKALAISIVNTAVFIEVNPESRIFSDVRIAVGSVGPTVIRVKEVELLLKGQTCSKRNIEKAAAAAKDYIKPIDDIRSTAKYRQNVIGLLIQKALNDAYEKLGLAWE